MAENVRRNDHQDCFRWWVLAATAAGMFAYGYAYDNPVALQRQLLTEFGLSNVQYNLLYSIYAFPNMILPTVAGILTDKYGYNCFIILFFGLMVMGQALFVFGCYMDGMFYVLLTARLLFGIGAETHTLVETPLIIDYFGGKELAFALALHLSCARAGSSLNDICSYLAYSKLDASENEKIAFATSIGLFLLMVCFVMIIVMVLVHKHKVGQKKRRRRMEAGAKRRGKQHHEAQDAHMHHTQDYSATINSMNKSLQGAAAVEEDVSFSQSPHVNNVNDHHHHHLNAPLISTQPPPPDNDYMCGTNEAYAPSVVSHSTVLTVMHVSDIKEFDLVYWLLTWNCSIMYAIVTAWMNIGSDFLQVTYGYSHGTANGILAIPFSLAAVLQPLWGWISDRYGCRAQLLLVASVTFVATHYAFGWIRIDGNPLYLPIAALAMFGVGFSIFSAIIWPCFPLVVPPRAISTAYGIPMSGYNSTQMLFYLLVGVLTSSVDSSAKYKNVQYLLVASSAVTVLTSLWLLYQDRRTGSRLYPPALSMQH